MSGVTITLYFTKVLTHVLAAVKKLLKAAKSLILTFFLIKEFNRYCFIVFLMVNCSLCGKFCKNLAGLSGHIQFKHPGYKLPPTKIPKRQNWFWP